MSNPIPPIGFVRSIAIAGLLLASAEIAGALSPTIAATAPKPAQPPIQAPPAPASLDPVRQALLAELRDAKRLGDESAARGLEADLSGSVAAAASTAPEPAPGIRVFVAEAPSPQPKSAAWGNDVCIGYPEPATDDPALAVRSDGTLYAAVVAPDPYTVRVYRSEDNGAHWTLTLWATSYVPVADPCLVVGEGNVDRLVLAFVRGSGTVSPAIYLLWYDLNDATLGAATIDAGMHVYLSNPRLCVDSPEYSYWYPYLVYREQGIDPSEVRFSRSLDYGTTWTGPTSLFLGLPFLGAPDIDFGGDALTVAYGKLHLSATNIFLRRSTDFGLTFAPEFLVTPGNVNEDEPRVASTASGDTVMVAFAREYGVDNHDIDCVWSGDHGATWYPAYLPYSALDERRPAISASPLTGRLQAAYWREGEICWTWADVGAITFWASPLVVNDYAAADDAWPAIAIRPSLCACFPDLNCDGGVDENDFAPFSLAMSDPAAYRAQYPNCDIGKADADCDGDIDDDDLDRLVCLVQGGPDCCPEQGERPGIAWAGLPSPQPAVWFDNAALRPSAAPWSPPLAPLVSGRPNPFNARTTIEFGLAAEGPCRVAIYAATGRRVAVLQDGLAPAGPKAVTWDGRDDRGLVCPSGVYFVRLEAGDRIETYKLALVK